MAQNSNFQQLDFEINNLIVSKHLEITFKVELRQVDQIPPQEYLTVTEIAYHLSQSTGQNWTPRRVNEMLEDMKYQQNLYKHWQPTNTGQHYADFSSRVPKWSPEVINLILQQQPQQLRLAV